MKPLLDHCQPAPFGDGKKTRYDRNVRDALQLKAEGGAFSILGFDPESAGILKMIQQELVPHDPNPISAELYTVNVYTEGGHFAPHKDTPRGHDMFGTLVVCLPSQFMNGNLVLSHRGVVQKFDWGSVIAEQDPPNRMHWAAFFGDVDHEIERIWGGARVTLTYHLLRRAKGGAPTRIVARQDLAPRIEAAWQALLADKSFLPRGGILGYPCCHLYHQDARYQRKRSPLDRPSATLLKGRDQLVAATALEAGLNVTFNAYMFESGVDETWQLERFPTSKEKSKLHWQVEATDLERALPIRADSENDGDFGVTWLEPPPSSDTTTWRSKEDRDRELPAAAHLHSADYCPWGYFGNESSEVDFYTFAALHMEIPKFGQGIRAPTKPSTRAPAKRKRSSSRPRRDSE
ncbi:MAG: hypothetical protein L0Y72_30250 [Gemmataceae bacterium]|nr:hypothetical protein [Gemmataceae bacterium]MCI0743331.1 hypothetical protein [Gemmataceae bacterium]